nr:MAG TPA: hypothetical protein [Caudoviricetes sp.]
MSAANVSRWRLRWPRLQIFSKCRLITLSEGKILCEIPTVVGMERQKYALMEA